ncbi:MULTISPECIES: hypothetical protein [unclassified Haladaptatus]|nr:MULTISPECIES: hypothetical protein [unclassified Haladaptatus]MCO8244057.1 hypothetical protein [Haladaptatus sp. AB643]MCO8255863.1 hypothetical protein [Haladaptatus sp. AB618]
MTETAETAGFDHPAWKTAASTVGSYLLILVSMTVLLFGIPYAIFWLLG